MHFKRAAETLKLHFLPACVVCLKNEIVSERPERFRVN